MPKLFPFLYPQEEWLIWTGRFQYFDRNCDYNQVEWLCIHVVRPINCPSGPLSLLALLLSLSFSFPIIHAPELERGFYLPLVIRNPSYIIAFLVLEKWAQVSHFFCFLCYATNSKLIKSCYLGVERTLGVLSHTLHRISESSASGYWAQAQLKTSVILVVTYIDLCTYMSLGIPA